MVRPDHTGGRLARAGVLVFALMLLLPAMMARLPEGWIEAASGEPLVVRAILVIAALLVVRVAAVGLYALLPRAVILFGDTLIFPRRGRPHRMKVAAVAAIRVELRPLPRGETIVLVDDGGAVHDLCPVHWSGAGRLWAALAARVGDAQPPRPSSAASAR